MIWLVAVFAVCVVVQLELLRREQFNVCIVRRHEGHWVRVTWVSKRSKRISEALNTPGMAVMRDGRIEEGKQ